VIETVAGCLAERNFTALVVDPVMISKSGFELLADEAVAVLRDRLLPLALVATPNLHEAALLAGLEIHDVAGMREAARRICDMGPASVIVKGGHAPFARGTDVLFDGSAIHEFPARNVAAGSVHGTGCTFSAAITARLALGEPLHEAVANAKTYTTRAIERQLEIGSGPGPAHHFYFIGSSDFRKP
jgi:hydroxymethylpyrimidine/phosphomethylpyrimidine kinase